MEVIDQIRMRQNLAEMVKHFCLVLVSVIVNSPFTFFVLPLFI